MRLTKIKVPSVSATKICLSNPLGSQSLFPATGAHNTAIPGVILPD
jgi:hypothetical protein